MKVLFLTNNPNTRPLEQWLRDEGETVIRHSRPLSLAAAEVFSPDFIISYNYRHILKPAVVHAYRHRIINLHIAMLPWNRGTHQNLWAWLDGAPHGVTIHEIDEGVDTGDILLQRSVCLDTIGETLASSYTKLHESLQGLFREHWAELRVRTIRPQPQAAGGSFHRSDELDVVRHLFPNFSWDLSVEELLRVWKENQEGK